MPAGRVPAIGGGQMHIPIRNERNASIRTFGRRRDQLSIPMCITRGSRNYLVPEITMWKRNAKFPSHHIGKFVPHLLL